MESWVFYGIVAAICFGINTVIFKIAIQKGNLNPAYASLIFGVGISTVFLFYYFAKPNLQFELKSTLLALIAGVIWAIGFLAIAVAIANKGNVAQLAPIYNANTIIAVILGIILLKEVPNMSQMIRIIIGTLMIVGGAVLVSI
ncbi:EamA family transporter [Candidatus Woesearchaeota archaeon]|nr:EamA family transporter [Candidatus Woesearchaeota archaeon]